MLRKYYTKILYIFIIIPVLTNSEQISPFQSGKLEVNNKI